jgi:toxin ParE1/3/4
MKPLRRREAFNRDVIREWVYLAQFGEDLADRFVAHVEAALHQLEQHPGLGRPRRFRHPTLHGLRSWAVERPFANYLIFYRDQPEAVELFRLMHGARDLPRRLVEPGD